MAGPFDHLHIKRRTAGSSNELSFDVLDAARSDLDGKRARAARAPTAPRPSQGNYQGVGATSTLSAIPEVERRKRARRARTIRIWTVSLVAVVALAAAGGYLGYRLYQDRMDFTAQFDRLLARIVEVDEVTARADALMVDPLNSVEREERARLLDEFPDALSRLESIAADAASLAESPVAPPDSAELVQVQAAAYARTDMLEAAADAFKLSEIVGKQADAASDAWNLVLAGDSMAREAAKLANGASTEEATLDARAKTQEAIESLGEARKELEILAREMEGVDFAEEIAYIAKRLESLDAAVETSDALLANDRAAAAVANDAYNAADAEAVALARALPASPADRVKASYDDEAKRLADAYGDARSHAITADSALR